ncbi:PD-(D/E)XK nuclease-like domain-containing protein [Nitratifractor salsuginis]|uniref:Putative exodeoxyribonuclease 8 PDDEXK-like domain-containing protein n=1 Tax=Nitratifractor salsuginis (strain DSM 16511 / JCM 12458 / E9I37-1) TaxID=749222 RepID=E6WYE1_NITSE|nr:PD-(D/E)XK nuclease-like domain-containing protein [Nitratifractor salsuginis]ADV46453.1 hypothetical protein Nitsa_1200 [Nitratifractor salsuginis DSM 16511]
MTNAEYHAAEGISASDFRLLEKSPLHYEHKELFKLEGPQFNLGTLVHKMVLEPDTLGDEFVKEDFEGCELNKNSKAYKEANALFLEECQGKTVVPVNVWEQAEAMARNVMAIAGGLLQGGKAEQSIFADDKLYEVRRKCRPDYYRPDLGIVIDLKTTADGSERGFAKSLYQYRYHRQAAWYLDTMQMAGHNAETFIFITVETSKPYMVDIWEIEPLSIEAGRENYNTLLAQYHNYKTKGVANIVKPISIPDWGFKEE